MLSKDAHTLDSVFVFRAIGPTLAQLSTLRCSFRSLVAILFSFSKLLDKQRLGTDEGYNLQNS